MLSLARATVRLPFGTTMLPSGLTVRLFAHGTAILGQMSDDGLLAVAPRGLLHEHKLPAHVSDLNGVTVTAIARTEQELLTLRSLTTNPLHFTLVSQE